MRKAPEKQGVMWVEGGERPTNPTCFECGVIIGTADRAEKMQGEYRGIPGVFWRHSWHVEFRNELQLRTVLFNELYAAESPDWTRFDAIEVSPVAVVKERDGSTACEVIHDDRTPDKWSVYGHYRYDDPRNADENTRGVVCITDCATQALAEAIGLLFEQLIPKPA